MGRLRRVLLGFVLGWAACAAAFAAPIAVGDFFNLPKYADVQLSPDGRTMAALVPINGRRNLAVIDLATKKATALSTFEDQDVVWALWLNDKRLLARTGSLTTNVDDAHGGGLYAVDIDGGTPKIIAESPEQQAAQQTAIGRWLAFVRRLPGETDDFIGQEWIGDRKGGHPGALFRIDSRSGRRTDIGFGKPDTGRVEQWVVDNAGVARAFMADSEGRVRIYARASARDDWVKLDEFGENDANGWMPLAVADDDRQLVATTRNGGRDKAAIALYDPAKKKFGDVLAAHPRIDLYSVVVSRAGRMLGVSFEADRGGAAWFDETLAKVQAAVDKALPDTVNQLSWSDDMRRFIVTAYSDVQPGSFYLLDLKSGRLEWLADSRPWIKPAEMAPMKPVHYAARDGLDIPAYLTLPKGSSGKDLPLVLVVHGGPWVEGYEWRFDPEAQFLASRGYAVLQPNFRGTTRYGWKHYHAAFGQWGLAMQDDLADGVKWAIAQGIADPRRVCIYGASYGGYAAMMGLARNPELFRCGVNYVGVTDLPLFLTISWADYAYSDSIEYAVKDLVGDVDKDAERLRATSPVNLAARIKAPVFMAYGAADRRVPIEHGLRMKAALDKAGVKYQWMVGEGEGHGFRDPKNRDAFYTAMEKFLAENLKPR